MSNPSRILIISPGVPHPIRGASTVLYYHYIKYFEKLGLPSLTVLLTDRTNSTPETIAEFQSHFKDSPNMSIFPVTSEYSIRNRLFNVEVNTKMLGPAIEQMRKFKPDLIICFDFISVCAANLAFPNNDIKKTVWLGDLLFETQWFHALYAFKESHYLNPKDFARLLVVAVRCQFVKKYYLNALSGFSHVIASSKSAENGLTKIGVTSNYLPYPWPEEAARSKVPGLPKKPTFLFLGTLSALGSRSAFHFMSRKFYQELLRMWGSEGFSILMAGSRELPAWVHKTIQDKPEFKYVGFVDDLTALMQSCHAVIAPIAVPVGNRSRIITAMANRTPVIAHSSTALGNTDLVNEETCLLADTEIEFVTAMRRLYEDRQLAKKLAEAARDRYDNRFSLTAACKILHNEVVS